jgi:antitoxin HicB
MIAYPAKFVREKKGIAVTFPDLPEAVTSGESEQEAMEFAVDALETVLSEYIKRRRAIPGPARFRRGQSLRLVTLPALAEAKVRLYEAMRLRGLRKADLARRVGWRPSQIDRLLNLNHSSRLERVEEALRALDMRLVLTLEDVRNRAPLSVR